MSFIRPCTRASAFRSCTRLNSSIRHLRGPPRRFNSSEAAPASSIPPATEPPKPRRRVNLRPWIYATIFFALGLTSGNLVSKIAVPPAFPEPHTPEDAKLLDRIARDIDALPIVKQLRAETYHLRADTVLEEDNHSLKQESQEQGWRELSINSLGEPPVLHTEAKTINTADTEKKTRRPFTQDTLAGAGRFGIQRAFWNPTTRELISVIWFGGALSGWPGMAHGGSIATVFEEGLSRVVAGPDGTLESVSPPKSLSLTYVKPTLSNNFYILRSSFASAEVTPDTATAPAPAQIAPDLPSKKDMTKKTSISELVGKDLEVVGTIETLEGKVCVKAKAAFPANLVGSEVKESTSTWGKVKRAVGFLS